MGFFSFAGRVLFASVFLLSAYLEFNEFGVDGGPAAKAFTPKFNQFKDHVTTFAGFPVPEVEVNHIIAASIALKGVGGLLFILSSSFGAYLLLLQLLVVTPIMCDFYNFDKDKQESIQLLVKFTENLALVGALLYFLAMKNLIPKRQPKKKGGFKAKAQ
ncbi:hypothetical protein QJS04_geneDACA000345 [Acorus gramineus]|uniref:HR-like lesion-inducer n=1 Tax=Acorus gramineus TaxID=55184 RepID=A0AAV9APE8_ACOGR|nr:hypothetical protein QJS04_geneDACA000345 [Acorus gramineus]